MAGVQDADAELFPVQGLSTNAPELGVASNGTRHWTSSFASVDWVHDAIKGAPCLLCVPLLPTPR